MGAEKRKRDHSDSLQHPDGNVKSRKRGITVGPRNLPDGSYKRKTQKIKGALIQRAQIKKSYEKLKKQGKIPAEPRDLPEPTSIGAEDRRHEPNTVPHPDRQTLIEDDGGDDSVNVERGDEAAMKTRTRRAKHVPFQREYSQGQRRKAEAEERRKAREESERQREQKIQERAQFRKAMAKARESGPNGQRKLGRQSKVLLQKVRRMVGEG